MKLSIVGGGGEVGSTAAYVISQKNIVNEICLIDIRENVAKDHQMDMEQAVCAMSNTRITTGGFDMLKGSDIVILAVGAVLSAEEKHKGKKPSRMNFLAKNLEIIKSVSQYIKEYAKDAIIINASNPLDVMNSMIHRFTGISKQKIIGFSLNDTLRFRWAISKILHVHTSRVQGMVLGEHGEEQCPIFSQVYVDGVKKDLTTEQKKNVKEIIDEFLSQKASLMGGRTSGWLSGINLAYLLDNLITESEEVIPCSIIEEDGVSIGRPITLNKRGINQIMKLEMNQEELQQFNKAHSKISEILKGL